MNADEHRQSTGVHEVAGHVDDHQEQQQDDDDDNDDRNGRTTLLQRIRRHFGACKKSNDQRFIFTSSPPAGVRLPGKNPDEMEQRAGIFTAKYKAYVPL